MLCWFKKLSQDDKTSIVVRSTEIFVLFFRTSRTVFVRNDSLIKLRVILFWCVWNEVCFNLVYVAFTEKHKQDEIKPRDLFLPVTFIPLVSRTGIECTCASMDVLNDNSPEIQYCDPDSVYLGNLGRWQYFSCEVDGRNTLKQIESFTRELRLNSVQNSTVGNSFQSLCNSSGIFCYQKCTLHVCYVY